jgi:hypothetical protein
MYPLLLQWRLYNHNIRYANLGSINIMYRTVYYACGGATVREKEYMAWMSAYIYTVTHLFHMIPIDRKIRSKGLRN